MPRDFVLEKYRFGASLDRGWWPFSLVWWQEQTKHITKNKTIINARIPPTTTPMITPKVGDDVEDEEVVIEALPSREFPGVYL